MSKETERGKWNSRQQSLRRLLMEEHDFQEALPVFERQHAAVHSVSLDPTTTWSCQDEALDGLSEAAIRRVPPGHPHSAAWLLWHITRIEDVTMNILLADGTQLFHTGNWREKLATSYEGMGNELPPEKIAALGERIDVPTLLAYRLAVGKRTREIVSAIQPDSLWSAPTAKRLQRLRDEGATNPETDWLLAYWGGHPAANLLLMPATRHAFLHLNEIQRMRPKLQRLQAK